MPNETGHCEALKYGEERRNVFMQFHGWKEVREGRKEGRKKLREVWKGGMRGEGEKHSTDGNAAQRSDTWRE